MAETTISDLIFRNNITSVQQDRVTNFMEAHGVDPTRDILLHIFNTRKWQERNGKRVGYAMTLWSEYSEKYVKSAEGRARADKADQEMAEAKKAHERAKAAGYQANRMTIRAQLEDLYDKGEISIHEYGLGMTGLNDVFGLVAQAKNMIDVPVEHVDQ